jgi:hypothetical protein
MFLPTGGNSFFRQLIAGLVLLSLCDLAGISLCRQLIAGLVVASIAGFCHFYEERIFKTFYSNLGYAVFQYWIF